jgi:acetyltransferase-like isoleucine patch superfamily enzyme
MTYSPSPPSSQALEMLEPEEINERELMEYYGYRGFAGKMKYYFRFIIHWALQSLAKVSPHPGLAVFLQRLRGVRIGRHVYIGPDTHIDDLYPELITIEDYCSIGMRSMVFAHANPTCSIEIKAGYHPREVKPTTIKRGAWIAPGSIILAGVTVGENSIVGAGSVVIRDVAPCTIVMGSPAKPIMKIDLARTKNSSNVCGNYAGEKQ